MKFETINTGRRAEIRQYLSAQGWTEAQIATALGHLEVTYFRDSDYENVSDLRLARVRNQAEEADYSAIRLDGCCGSHDVRRITADGEIVIGFNYGH